MTTAYLLIDTSSWLTLAEDLSLGEVLADLAKSLGTNRATLLVPEVVVHEFARNRAAVLGRAEKQFQTVLSRTRTVTRLLDAADRDSFERLLERAAERVTAETEVVAAALCTVERLLKSPRAQKLTPSAETRSRALDRAVAKQAPCHRDKNSAADALIIECFRDFVNRPPTKSDDMAVFVTRNKHDFSNPTDDRLPHPDLVDIFGVPRVRYSINLAEVLARIEPAKDWSREIAAYARTAAREAVCLFGGEHDYRDGAYLRSPLGGLTWQEWCSKCQAVHDPGEFWD